MATTATATATDAPGSGPAELEAFLINFVVEQTGYPAEVVDLDGDLEADLGIDSIKKAHLFSELQEFFDIGSAVTSLSLDDFTTLRHVLDFLVQNAASRSGTASSGQAVATTAPQVVATPQAVSAPVETLHVETPRMATRSPAMTPSERASWKPF